MFGGDFLVPTLQLTFRCQDNNYQIFQFLFSDYEASDAALRELIKAIIDNNSIFSNPPVSCLGVHIFYSGGVIDKNNLCTSFVGA